MSVPRWLPLVVEPFARYGIDGADPVDGDRFPDVPAMDPEVDPMLEAWTVSSGPAKPHWTSSFW